jgi:hypothetical protein
MHNRIMSWKTGGEYRKGGGKRLAERKMAVG